jgi:outer membrane protein assembly factor BamB
LANWSSPVVFREPASGREIVALQSGRGLLAIDPASGGELWNYSDGASTIASTAVSDGVLFVPSFGVTALKPGQAGQTPERLWRANNLRPDTSSPLVLGEHVYTINGAGVLTCGSATKGERLWQLRLKGPFSASPVAAGTFIYVASEKGLVQVVDPTKPEGEVVSELDLEESVLSTPAISGDALFLRSDHHLWKITEPPINADQPEAVGAATLPAADGGSSRQGGPSRARPSGSFH